MKQIQTKNTQIIDDDCLIRILSFIPPIPFFFTTIPLINKQLYLYFYNFVTTCPIEELNYFREINYWEFGCCLEKPQKQEHLDILENHFKLLLGEQFNDFCNTLQQRILQTTETIFLPRWATMAYYLKISKLLTHFKNLKTVVLPPVYQENYYLEFHESSKLSLAPTGIPKQCFIFLNWSVQRVEAFFGEYFKTFEERSEKDPSIKIPQIQKILLVEVKENGAVATEETRKKFQNSNFFMKTTQYESLFDAIEADGNNEKASKDGNVLIKSNLELEEFRAFSGFKKQKLKNVETHAPVSFFHFSIANNDHQRLFALLNYLGIKKAVRSQSEISLIQGIMYDLGVKVDKLTLWLSECFLDGWTSIARIRKQFTPNLFAINPKDSIEPDEEFFCEIFTSFKKMTNLAGVNQVKLVKIGQEENKNESIVLYDFADFINDTPLNIAKHIPEAYLKKLGKFVESMHWDILRISFLQKNLNNLIENSKKLCKEAETAKKTLKDLRKLWKICFSVTNFGEWVLKFDHVMIFKIWEKLETDLVRKIFGKTELHYLIPFLLDSGEPGDSPKFAGILNTPSSKTGELPIEILLKKNPQYAISIARGELNPTSLANQPKLPLQSTSSNSTSSLIQHSREFISNETVPQQHGIPRLAEIEKQKRLHFRVKRVSNPKEIDEKYIMTKFIQTGQTENVPFDLIHDRMKTFPIEDIVMPLEFQIPPQIYEISHAKVMVDRLTTKIAQNSEVLIKKLKTCLDCSDDFSVFSFNFNEFSSEMSVFITDLTTMFKYYMESAHVFKDMFDAQTKAKTGKNHSITSLSFATFCEKLDLFPNIPKKKVSFLEIITHSNSRCEPHESIESSEYVQKSFLKVVEIAGETPQVLSPILSHLISLSSKIQRQMPKNKSNDSCSTLDLFHSIQNSIAEYPTRFSSYPRFMARSGVSSVEILKTLQQKNELLIKISEKQRYLDKSLFKLQKQQSIRADQLKVFKFMYDLEYFQFQMTQEMVPTSNVVYFLAANQLPSSPNMKPFRFEVERVIIPVFTDAAFLGNLIHEEQGKILEFMKPGGILAIVGPIRDFMNIIAPEISNNVKREEISLLLDPFRNETEIKKQNSAILNNYIFRSIFVPRFPLLDFSIFEKFPNIKFHTREILILETYISFLSNSVSKSGLDPKVALERHSMIKTIGKILKQIETRCPTFFEIEDEDSVSDKDSNKRKREQSEEENCKENIPKKRKKRGQ